MRPLLLLLLLPSCAQEPRAADPGDARSPIVLANPFAPTRMRLHPLSRLERAGTDIVLVAHVELLDRWNDTTKGLGLLTLELYRADRGPDASQELSWDINLGDLELNASLYDPSTRTYRIQLAGLGPWAADAIDRQNDTRLLLRARWRAPDGRDSTLTDDMEVR